MIIKHSINIKYRRSIQSQPSLSSPLIHQRRSISSAHTYIYVRKHVNNLKITESVVSIKIIPSWQMNVVIFMGLV